MGWLVKFNPPPPVKNNVVPERDKTPDPELFSHKTQSGSVTVFVILLSKYLERGGNLILHSEANSFKLEEMKLQK